MSNISRRDFLKTAGVMTLAVAAAGVLAGCEGNATKPEVPEVTQNTVTVGNYTLSLKDVKQYSVKEFEKGNGSNETNKLKNEDRYVVALLNLSIIDESKYDAKDESTELFGLEDVVTKMIRKSSGAVSKGDIDNAKVQKLLGLDMKPEEFVPNTTKFKGYNPASVKKGAGKNYIIAYAVDKTVYADGAIEFKAPELSFIVDDAKGHVYTKMDAVIPAAVEVEQDKLLRLK